MFVERKAKYTEEKAGQCPDCDNQNMVIRTFLGDGSRFEHCKMCGRAEEI